MQNIENLFHELNINRKYLVRFLKQELTTADLDDIGDADFKDLLPDKKSREKLQEWISESASQKQRTIFEDLILEITDPSKRRFLKSIKHDGQKYERAFQGKRFVLWLEKHKDKTSEEAVKIGEQMMKLDLIRSISEEPFTDSSNNYQFTAGYQTSEGSPYNSKSSSSRQSVRKTKRKESTKSDTKSKNSRSNATSPNFSAQDDPRDDNDDDDKTESSHRRVPSKIHRSRNQTLAVPEIDKKSKSRRSKKQIQSRSPVFENISSLFESMSISKEFVEICDDENIDFDALSLLSSEEMKELGFKMGDRKKLIQWQKNRQDNPKTEDVRKSVSSGTSTASGNDSDEKISARKLCANCFLKIPVSEIKSKDGEDFCRKCFEELSDSDGEHTNTPTSESSKIKVHGSDLPKINQPSKYSTKIKLPGRESSPTDSDTDQIRCSLCDGIWYESKDIIFDEKHYHKKCFRCTDCNKQQTVSSVRMIEETLYCQEDYKRRETKISTNTKELKSNVELNSSGSEVDRKNEPVGSLIGKFGKFGLINASSLKKIKSIPSCDQTSKSKPPKKPQPPPNAPSKSRLSSLKKLRDSQSADDKKSCCTECKNKFDSKILRDDENDDLCQKCFKNAGKQLKNKKESKESKKPTNIRELQRLLGAEAKLKQQESLKSETTTHVGKDEVDTLNGKFDSMRISESCPSKQLPAVPADMTDRASPPPSKNLPAVPGNTNGRLSKCTNCSGDFPKLIEHENDRLCSNCFEALEPGNDGNLSAEKTVFTCCDCFEKFPTSKMKEKDGDKFCLACFEDVSDSDDETEKEQLKVKDKVKQTRSSLRKSPRFKSKRQSRSKSISKSESTSRKDKRSKKVPSDDGRALKKKVAAPTQDKKCAFCNHYVRPGEALNLKGVVFHTWCFKCSKCRAKLKKDSYALEDSALYCLPCKEKVGSDETPVGSTTEDE